MVLKAILNSPEIQQNRRTSLHQQSATDERTAIEAVNSSEVDRNGVPNRDGALTCHSVTSRRFPTAVTLPDDYARSAEDLLGFVEYFHVTSPRESRTCTRNRGGFRQLIHHEAPSFLALID